MIDQTVACLTVVSEEPGETVMVDRQRARGCCAERIIISGTPGKMR